MEGGKVIWFHSFILDDDINISKIIEKYLLKEKYKVESFNNPKEMLIKLEKEKPDLIVLDIMMPEMDGYEVCKKIRQTDNIPIIFVSAKDDELDKVLGLELGADDYLSKPFSPRELLARIKVILRRMGVSKPTKVINSLELKNTKISLEERIVHCDDIVISLTSKEFDLLSFMVKNKNKAFTREDILRQVWGYEHMGSTRSVDDLIKRLRKQLTEYKSDIKISTVWGFGYKVEEK